jgi:hypothetical protein
MEYIRKEIEINMSAYSRPVVRRIFKKMKKDSHYRNNGYSFSIEGRVISALVPEHLYDNFYGGFQEAAKLLYPETKFTEK